MKIFGAAIMLIASTPLLTQPIESDVEKRVEVARLNARADPDVMAAIAEIKARVTMAGPTVTDWQTRGIDIVAQMDAKDGGVHRNILMSEAGEPEVRVFGTRRIEVPEGWQAIPFLRRDVVNIATFEHSIARLTPNVWITATTPYRMVGTAMCYDEMMEAAVLLPPGVELKLEDEFALGMMIIATPDWDEIRTCLIHESQPDGSIAVRWVTPDGASLPALDEDNSRYRVETLAKASAIFTR